MKRFIAKKVLTWSPKERILRLLRLAVSHQRDPSPGRPLSRKLTVALRPRWFERGQEVKGWLITAFGVRLHYQLSFGGHEPE